MYSTCLHCHRSLGTNEAVEQFPIGRRLAFDAAKGRLWVVCAHCGRWNLTPIEERWEAVEECERMFRGLKMRTQTRNIGLAKTPDATELIRIGAPLRPELASWRYGRLFRQRLRKQAALVGGLGGVAGAGALLVAGAPLFTTLAPFLAGPAIYFAIGGVLVRDQIAGTSVIGEEGKAIRVTRANLEHTTVSADEGALRLHLRHSYGRQELSGDRAVRALSTLMLFANRGGGTSSTIDNAARLISDAGDARRAIADITHFARARTGNFEERVAEVTRAPRGRTIGEALRAQMAVQRRIGQWGSDMQIKNPGALHRLPPPHRLALEMALHETYEELALDDELASLERAWQEAEEIAAIADDLLVPPNVRAQLAKKQGR